MIAKTLSSEWEKMLGRVRPRCRAGLAGAGQELLSLSRILVPKDTMALVESSGTREESGPGKDTVVVFYGRKGDIVAAHSAHEKRNVVRVPFDYAKFVHENPQKVHPNGEHEFLLKPCLHSQGEITAAFRAGAAV